MKIAFLGDIALIGKYNLAENPNGKERLEKLRTKLLEFDYIVANLESPLTSREKTFVCKSMHLKSDPINVDILKYLNINAVSLANNHIYDYGKKGMQETLDTLNKNNIEWFGLNSISLKKEILGEKIALSGFCCLSTNGSGYDYSNSGNGINVLRIEEVIKQFDQDKKDNSLSLLSIHWGEEHTNYPNYEHIKLTEFLRTKKDAIITGHHPHIIQGIQKNENSLVAYSLGNCLFDDCLSINKKFAVKQNESNKKSFILEVNIEKEKITSYKCHGFKDEEKGIAFFDISQEMKQISNVVNNIEEPNIYQELRSKQILETRKEKFGDKDINWILNKMNYYSVGAKIMSKIRRRKYLIEKDKFLGKDKSW